MRVGETFSPKKKKGSGISLITVVEKALIKSLILESCFKSHVNTLSEYILKIRNTFVLQKRKKSDTFVIFPHCRISLLVKRPRK